MMLTRPIRFTRFGTFYVLFSIGIGAAAINTGNNLLYLILGILLGFIVISGFLSDSGLWGITTEWNPLGSLYAGERAVFECRVQKGWFPGVAVTIESRWQDHLPIKSFAAWIPAKGSLPLQTSIVPNHRGYLTLESCHYSTSFPFGLFQKSHTRQMRERWVVFPRIERLPWDFFESHGEHLSNRSFTIRQGLGSVPLVLRDYRAGDALRQVNWKMSAKRQRLIVKEMEEEASEGDLFYLGDWPRNLSPDEMERFISFVASLIFTAYERNRPVGLVTPDRLFKPELSRVQLNRIFEYLALVDPFETAVRSPRSDVGRRTMDVLTLWRSYVRDL